MESRNTTFHFPLGYTCQTYPNSYKCLLSALNETFKLLNLWALAATGFTIYSHQFISFLNLILKIKFLKYMKTHKNHLKDN